MMNNMSNTNPNFYKKPYTSSSSNNQQLNNNNKSHYKSPSE
jgi:hypothetical protein